MKEINETLELLNNRRTLRSYSSKKIAEEDKQRIIKAAMRAPTGSNMMMYSIIEVDDPEKKATLVKTCNNLHFIEKAPLVLIFAADMQRTYDYYEKSGAKEMVADMGLEYERPLEGDLLVSSCDALIAAHTACIAAESMGIGSCYIGDILEHTEVHREMFKLPRWVLPITMLVFGYPKRSNKPLNLSPRFDQKYIHFKNEYKQLNKEEFDDMYKDVQISNYRPGAKNLGQHFYMDFISTVFVKEINRSSKIMVDEWMKEED